MRAFAIQWSEGSRAERRTRWRAEVSPASDPAWRWGCLLALSAAFGYAAFEHGGRGNPVSWNLSLLIIGLAGIVYAARAADADFLPLVKCPLGAAALLAPAFVMFQLIPLPLWVLRALSPTRAELLNAVGRVTPISASLPLSIDPATTSLWLLRIVAYAVLFFTAMGITRAGLARGSWAAAFPIVVLAVFEAGRGLGQAAAGTEVVGSYWNRNHYAGLLEMVLPIAAAYAIRGGASSERAERSSVLSAGRVLPGAAAVALILVGLIASSSKSGVVAGLCGLFVTGGIAIAGRASGRRRVLGMGVLAASILVVFLALPTDEFVSRFGAMMTSDPSSAEGRVPIWRDSLALIKEYPLVGSGFGTYGTAFLKHQTKSVDSAFDFAHNDYLELLIETGLAGFAVFGVLFITLGVRTWRTARGGIGHEKSLAMGCAGAFTAIGLHSAADFNSYIPANALVLAWISGIAAALPRRVDSSVESTVGSETPARVLRQALFAMAALLAVYAGAWVIFARSFRQVPAAEAWFCRLGICDTDAVVEGQLLSNGGAIASVPRAVLAEAVKRDPANPSRWCDLGEAFQRDGQSTQARYCFDRATALGPEIPPVLLRAVRFYGQVNQKETALALAGRVLRNSSIEDIQIFDWYEAAKIPIGDVLRTFPAERQAAHDYLHYLMRSDAPERTPAMWEWMAGRGLTDDALAADYVNSLSERGEYPFAVNTWRQYLASAGREIASSGSLLNGGFEWEPLRSVFDWRIDPPSSEVQASIDRSVARSGQRSLRVRFAGHENVSYQNVFVRVFVAPGTYQFKAYVRADALTTDNGIGFHIVGDSREAQQIDLRTETIIGTTDWKAVEQQVVVPRVSTWLTVRVERQKSLMFDSLISGTAWVDDVSLTKAGVKALQ